MQTSLTIDSQDVAVQRITRSSATPAPSEAFAPEGSAKVIIAGTARVHSASRLRCAVPLSAAPAGAGGRTAQAVRRWLAYAPAHPAAAHPLSTDLPSTHGPARPPVRPAGLYYLLCACRLQSAIGSSNRIAALRALCTARAVVVAIALAAVLTAAFVLHKKRKLYMRKQKMVELQTQQSKTMELLNEDEVGTGKCPGGTAIPSVLLPAACAAHCRHRL